MTSLIVTTADYQTGKTQQTTFTGVNPAATAAELQTFAQMTAALSKDSYVKAVRLDATALDTTKAARTLNNSIVWSGSNQFTGTVDGLNITFNLPLSKVPTNNNRLDVWVYSNSFSEDTMLSTISGDFSSLVSMTWAITRWSSVFALAEVKAQTVNIQMYIPENDTYQAATINVTINITEG